MDINWGTLAGVFGVSLGITVVVVVMFSLGLAAWAQAVNPAPDVPRGRHQKMATAAAALCFAASLAVAAYGIDLIVPG
ncbi:hypothetical protein [Streptomyces sp. Isolate_219]|uniref:hypothetical protein n=1 Tax=Streptomyces sp. Isolate_219 TaxID=2950110 RepID=UPI0021C9F194|nr:hypothetical protein [Streptomyces sp. Isolate_219]MCR8574182.1 hypothetical protein [Streptomyces sp. Isolate_219]